MFSEHASFNTDYELLDPGIDEGLPHTSIMEDLNASQVQSQPSVRNDAKTPEHSISDDTFRTQVCWTCCAPLPQISHSQSSLLRELSELRKELEEVREKNILLEQKVCELSVDLNLLRKDHDQSMNIVSQYELENAKASYSKKDILEHHDETSNQLRDILHPYFTDTQIDYFLTQDPVRKWSEDDIARALAFRAISPNGYKYVREQLNLPYPSTSTLKRWTQSYHFEPGLQDIVLKLMKKRGENMTTGEKACVISFDEMKITKAWEFRRTDETILSPHNYVQVVMVRGILGRWKQVVYYGFDEKITPDLLMEIIKAVEQSGFEVHATVCDMGSSNYSLLNKLGISKDVNTFLNPCDNSRKVHVFLDAPHLLKLVRNHFLDSGFQTNNDNHINCEPIRELMLVDNGNLKLAPKLKSQHLSVKGTERQRVKFAVQLLSGTVAKALTFLGNHGDIKSKNWSQTADFIRLINDWFDIFNSSIKIDCAGKRHSFQKYDKQLDTLSKITETIKGLRVSGKFLPFQKGILISCQSLKTLYNSLHERFSMSYILTRRLNQDVLEHFFSVIRQMGRCHDHPTPLSFQHRLKIYIMGKETTALSSNTNTAECESTPSVAGGIQEITDASESTISHEDSCLTSHVFTPDLKVTASECENSAEVDFELRFPEEEAIDHFLGFIVHKFQAKYPYLGAVLTNVNEGSTSWDAHISKGGLKILHPSYRDFFLTLEQNFREYHGVSLKEGKGAIEGVLKRVSIPNDIPREVASYFVRCRIYFRIKELNCKIKQSKYSYTLNPKKKINKICS